MLFFIYIVVNLWFKLICILKTFKSVLKSSFWPSKINYIKKTLALFSIFIKCLQLDLKNMMTPARFLIYSIVFKNSFILRNLYLLKKIFGLSNLNPSLPGANNFGSIILQLQIRIVFRKQIFYILTVYF
jgi:hypothetical protein